MNCYSQNERTSDEEYKMAEVNPVQLMTNVFPLPLLFRVIFM